MNIVKENIDELNAVLKVKVMPEDYINKVEEAIKSHQKKASMPGFRPGKVPAGMIKKMYGKSILVDEINRLLSDSVHKYIVDNKIDMLGNPLPKMDSNIDWDNQKEFDFSYDLGIAPKFEINISAKDKFVNQLVKIDDTLIDKYVNDIRKNFGKPADAETSEEKDLLFGDFVELDANGEILAGGIFKSSSVAIDRIKNADLQKQLIGLKKEDKVVLSPAKLSESVTDIAAMLGIKKEEVENLKNNFQFTVKNIARIADAEVDQDLFDKVYGRGAVANVEEFRNKIKGELENMFAGDSERKLKNEIVEALMKKHGLRLPDEFLKRWLMTVNEKPLTMDQINAEYPMYADQLRWQLIENKIMQEHKINVTAEEAMDYVKSAVKAQYVRYGRVDAPEDELITTAKKVLEKEEEARKIYDTLYDKKVMDLFKTTFTIENKEVPYDEFINKSK